MSESARSTTPQPHRRIVAAAAQPATPRLHFSLLTQSEKESFRAGLHTRLWTRLYEAVTAPTEREYRSRRDELLAPYVHLSEVLRMETGYAVDPFTDEDVLRALDQVEHVLGDSWRHKMEHAINMSRTATTIMARAGEADASEDFERELVLFTRWVGSWVLLNWSIDCAFAATDSRVSAQPEVIDAIFEDVSVAAQQIYLTAADCHDVRLGDPDDVS